MSVVRFAPISNSDFASFWPIFQSIVAAQETYAIAPDISFEAARQLWCTTPTSSVVAKDKNGHVLGAYYLKANAAGPGDHICNCGYMVAPTARGKGVARAMCEHSQAQAKELGFQAMQYNAVVATNEAAVALWKKLGFHIVGTVPNAFRHPRLGLVDTYVMYKAL